MNSPSQNRGHLPYYRSQVTTININKSPTSITQNKNNFKQSLVPDLRKKYHQYQANQSQHRTNKKYDELLSQRNYVKGYEHLLSPKNKQGAKFQLNTYRSGENLSPRTFRQNVYDKGNQTELQQNRSVKFISKLREQIISPQSMNECSRSTRKAQKQMMSPVQKKEKKRQQTLIESTVNRACQHELSNIKISENVDSSELIQNSQSPEREKFEKRLIEKCNQLQLEIQTKDRQILRLTHKLHALELKQIYELNLLKNQHMLEKSKKDSEVQILTRQLHQLQKSIKSFQKTKNVKEKNLQQEVLKYAKQLKEGEQQRNKMILEFQSVLKQRLQAKQKSCTDQAKSDLSKTIEENKTLKQIILNMQTEFQQIQQEKEDVFQQNELLSLQLTNYTKWNDELDHKARYLQRKIQEAEAFNQKYRKQNSFFQQKIEELQEIMKYKQKSIREMEVIQFKLSEEVEILRFETQSLKNEMQSMQRDLLKQKSLYVQQIEILDEKYLNCNNQRVQICEELQYQRKELANTRGLIDSLEQKLKDQRRDAQEIEALKDKVLMDYKQKSESLVKLRQEMIYKDIELQKSIKKIYELQEEIKLANMQRSAHNHNNFPIQQENSDEIKSNSDTNNNLALCLQRIQTLQAELNELITKFKEQKLTISKQNQKQTQDLKKRILYVQKQLFRKEESFIDDKKRHSLQSARYQQTIANLEQQLMMKNKEFKNFCEQLNIRDIKIKHLIRNVEELENTFEQKLTLKDDQMKQCQIKINQEIDHEKEVLLNMIESSFQEIQNCLDLRQKNVNRYEKKNKLGDTTQVQMAQQQSDKRKLETPKKRSASKQKSFSPSKFKLNFSLNTRQRCINDHQNSTEFIHRTRQIISFINLLNKKIKLYQTTINSLQSANQAQPIKIHQQYLQKINELERKIQQQQNKIELNKVEVMKNVDKEKQKMQRQIQKLSNQVVEKEKEIQELRAQLENDKKAKQQMQEKIQTNQKQTRKTIKKLNNDIEEYQNLIALMKEQKTNNPLEELQNNNITSMTTINRQDFQFNNQYLNMEKTPTTQSKLQHMHCLQKQEANFSLQQILEQRMNELTLHNEHLSSQLALVNTELMNQKQMFVDLNFVVRQLQKQIEKMSLQNDQLKQQLQNTIQKEKQVNQELISIQKQNNKNQEHIQHYISILKQSQSQLQTMKNKLFETQHSKCQLQRQLQASTKQTAQKYVDAKKLQQKIRQNEKQKQTLKSTLTANIQNLNSTISEFQSINESLKNEIQYQRSLAEEKNAELLKRIKEIEVMTEKVVSLQSINQKLQIQIEEWKFICESNSLNKSISLQLHKAYKESSSKTKNFTQHHQKLSNSRNRSKSPLKAETKCYPTQKQHLSQERNHNGSHTKNNVIISMTPNFSKTGVEINLLNSFESSQSFGPSQQFPKGKNAFSSSGEISFF